MLARNTWLLGILVFLLGLTGCKYPERIDYDSLKLDYFILDAHQHMKVSTRLKAGALYSVLAVGRIQRTDSTSPLLDAQNRYDPVLADWVPAPMLFIDGRPAVAAVSSIERSAYIFYIEGNGPIGSEKTSSFEIVDHTLNTNPGQIEIWIFPDKIDKIPDFVPEEGVRKDGTLVVIQTDKHWQSTNVYLKQGQRFSITATGVFTSSRESNIDGDGSNDVCSGKCCGPLPETRRSMLIGRIGDTPPFFPIGKSSDRLIAPLTGDLQLQVNECDSDLLNNQGTLAVTIQPQ